MKPMHHGYHLLYLSLSVPDTPLHVAIIPDGNRRWAKKRSLLPWEGHKKAVDGFQNLTEWCRNDPRVNVLTVWCFSTENWKRDEQEISKLMTMLEEYLAKERTSFAERNVRFVHSGRRDRIPASLAQLITEVEQETAEHDGFTLHLAVDYGGKDEILRATKKAFEASEAFEAHEAQLHQQLDHPDLPDIDLIIRTSGEQRTSNFFLWQATYAEWEFVTKFFPDFSANDLQDCIDRFASRTRRFGG